jgi:flagellar biosynthesis GTPase FlhF
MEGMKPAVISWDAFRVGGSSALQAYCEIAGLPFAVADSQASFQTALQGLGEYDLLLLDSAALEGDDQRGRAFRDCLREMRALEVHLVLSSTSTARHLRHCFETYSEYAPGFLLPTHLDEAQMELGAEGLEGLRSLTVQWCSTGRSVPEDLVEASGLLDRRVEGEAARVSAPLQSLLRGLRQSQAEKPTHRSITAA